MIAYLNGKLVYKDPTYVIVEVQGVGYEVKISLNTYAHIKDKEQIKLLTYLHIKEDAHTLYGFIDSAEKKTFLHLISISGVGPNTALVILSSLGPEDVQQAIIQGDVRVIQSVKGIGAKTAQRIILELKDKIAKVEGAPIADFAVNSHNTIKNEALSALTTLGINRAVAEKNINLIMKQNQGSITLEELIKQALKQS